MIFTCTSCKNSLPESSFQKRTPKKPTDRPVQYWCRSCMAKSKKNWRSDNPELYARERLKVTAHNRFKTHGISPEEYDSMVASQNGRCSVCERKPSGKKGLHASKIVKGLVCLRCQTGLAMFEENKEALQNAIELLD